MNLLHPIGAKFEIYVTSKMLENIFHRISMSCYLRFSGFGSHKAKDKDIPDRIIWNNFLAA